MASPPPPANSAEFDGQRTMAVDASSVMALDVGKLHAFLVRSGVYPADQPAPSVRKFSTGQSNPSYLVDGKWVLRKQPPGLGGKQSSAHRVDREFLVLKALQQTEVPAPKPIVLCEDPSVLGESFYLMSFVPGRVFVSPSLQKLTPDERRQAYRSVVETLVRIHQVDWRRVGLHDYGQAGGMFERQLASMIKVADAQEAVSPDVPRIPERDEMARIMRDWLPDDDVGLTHGDFKWDNLLMHPTEPRVAAVLDWELSTIGHPMSDVANFVGAIFTSPYNPDAPNGGGVVGMPDFETSGIPTKEEILRQYAVMTGRAYPDPHWNFYMAFYYWKNAIIAQGIGARIAQGRASSPMAAVFAATAAPLGMLALNELNELRSNAAAPPKKPVTAFLPAGVSTLDEYTHRGGKAARGSDAFTESALLSFCAPDGGWGGFLCMENRPSESTCDVTVAAVLGDGSLLWARAHPELRANNGWCSGGASVDVVRPLEKLRSKFAGRASLRKRSDVPGAPAVEVPAEVSLTLEHLAVGPAFAWGAAAAAAAAAASKDDSVRYAQHTKVGGVLDVKVAAKAGAAGGVAEAAHLVVADGVGFREHWWGPRRWRSATPDGHISASFGSELGFAVSFSGRWAGGEERKGAAVWHVGRDELVRGAARVVVEAQTPPVSAVTLTFESEGVVVRGEVVGFVPVHHVRGVVDVTTGWAVTRFTVTRAPGAGAGAIAKRLRAGMVGFGLCEVVDVPPAAGAGVGGKL